MYFTPQQLSGGPKYSHKTRVGNWSEDQDLGQHFQRDYLDKKDKGKLLINQTQQKFAKAFQKVPHTYSADGTLKFGDNVMLMCKQTNGFLVFDMSDKITSNDEAYGCTTTAKNVGPCGRSVVHIQKVNKSEGDDIVRYGEQVRFVTNPWIHDKELYLHSQQCSPQVFARFSRNQEVCLVTNPIYNTVWSIVPPDGAGSLLFGQPVQANTELIIEHCATKEFLSNDHIDYGNQFGKEFEISCKKAAVKHKNQQLALEGIGKTTIDLSNKQVDARNIWQILTALDPSASDPVDLPESKLYDGPTLVNDIRATIAKRGSFAVRALVNAFNRMDSNKDRSLNEGELAEGLAMYGLNLNKAQIAVLMRIFDRDGSGLISLKEFLRAMKGEPSGARSALIKEAYDKLDVNKNGGVTLDEIAKVINPTVFPEVTQGQIDPQEVYMQVMSLWDTQDPNGNVTFDEFADYWSDISACVDSDAEFEAILKALIG